MDTNIPATKSLFWSLGLLNRIFEDVYREAEREVSKKVREELHLEVRTHLITDDIRAFNIFFYMRSQMGWDSIIEKIKKYDDEHQAKNGLPIRTKDEIWNEMGVALLTMMNGFCKKKRLGPERLVLDSSWTKSVQ